MKIAGKLAVLGLGLIGGSALRGAVERGLAAEVTGWDAAPGALAAARAAGLGGHVALSLEAACRGADLAVVAVPVGAIPPLVDRVRRLLPAGAVVTDTGSAKGWILGEVARLAVEGRTGASPLPVFVGGHPMAGSHAAGFAASRADLFAGASWLVVPPGAGAGAPEAGAAAPNAAVVAAPNAAVGAAPNAAVERVAALAQGLGARPVVSDAVEHDRRLALTSHLPYLLALALTGLARSEGQPADLALFAAGGFRDATRLALQDPAMGTAFLAANAAEVRAALAAVAREAGGLLEGMVAVGEGSAAGAGGAPGASPPAGGVERRRAWREELGRIKRWA